MSDESSDPSLTTSSVEDSASDDSSVYDVKLPIEKIGKLETEEELPIRANPLLFFVIYDIIVPILICSCILSAKSIYSMIFVILLIIHVLNANLMTSYGSIAKFINIFEILVSFLGALMFFDEWLYFTYGFGITLHLLSSFPENFSIVSTFCFIMALLMIIFCISINVLSKGLLISEYIIIKDKFFGSISFRYFLDVIWTFSLCFVGSSQLSMFFIPLQLYLAYISLMKAFTGISHVTNWIRKFTGVYCALFSVFFLSHSVLFELDSNFFPKYKFPMIIDPSYKYVLMFSTVMALYLSIQSLFYYGRDNQHSHIPLVFHQGTGLIIVLSFSGIVVFSMFYPSYISVSWIALIFILTFMSQSSLKTTGFKIFSVFYVFTFLFALTSVSLSQYFPSFNVNLKSHLYDTGLFRYYKESGFHFFGNLIFGMIGLLGQLIYSQPYDSNTEENQKFWFTIVIGWIKSVFLYIVKVLTYLSIGCIFVFVSSLSFLNQSTFLQVMFAFCVFVMIFGILFKWVFYVIQFSLGTYIILFSFFETTSIKSLELGWVYKTGLDSINAITGFSYILPFSGLFVVSYFVINTFDSFEMFIGTSISSFVFLLLIASYLFYSFMFSTNIFSVVYLMSSVLISSGLIFSKNRLLGISLFFSSIFATIHLLFLKCTQFSQTRNFLQSIIPTRVLDLSMRYYPTLEIIILATIIFLNVSLFKIPRKSNSYSLFLTDIFEEIKTVTRSFYFYLSWGLFFGYSVSNYYPTCIKFLFMVLFFFGSKVAIAFRAMFKYLFVFVLVFLMFQFIVNIFPMYFSGSESLFRYIGVFFSTGNSTILDRNYSISFLVSFVFLSLVNIIASNPKEISREFGSYLVIRLYSAICATLHHWLPVIVQICLCFSTLLNPSIFGWIMFGILVLVTFNPSYLKRYAGTITIIFNICFVIQYLLWLGGPGGRISLSIHKEWGRFLGLSNVDIASLISNCLSALVFTFYLQFDSLFVDYNDAFEKLPAIIRDIVMFFVTYIFELSTSIGLLIISNISSFDGLFFFLLTSSLFMSSLLFDYQYKKTMKMQLWGTFLVLGGRLLSRIPIFSIDSPPDGIKKAFDLPFNTNSNYDTYWIFVFSLQCLCLHIMETPIFVLCKEQQTKRSGFRFIRSRQLKVISKLSQEVLHLIHMRKISSIKNMTENSYDIGQSINNIVQSSPESSEDNSIGWFNTIKEKVLFPLEKKIIMILAPIIPLNKEIGVNVLTLNSISIILRREIAALKSDREYVLQPNERAFLRSLPPSFHYQLHSLGDLMGFDVLPRSRYHHFLTRYISIFIRGLSCPLLIVVSLFYLFQKPCLFSYIFFIFLFIFIVSANISGSPLIYRVLFGLSLFNLAFRHLVSTPFISSFFDGLSSSVSAIQSSLSLVSFFGIDSTSSMVIEKYLFIICTWFIVDQIAFVSVFPPAYYFEKLKSTLHGFPDECYYHFEDPEKSLSLNVGGISLYQSIRNSMKQLGLVDSYHYIWLLIVDIISVAIYTFNYKIWIQDPAIPVSFSSSSLDSTFILLLMYQVITTLICYLFLISYNQFALYVFGNIMMIINIILVFIYFPILSRTISPSLLFYFLVRFLAHIIIAHSCVTGRYYIDFQFPNFKKNGEYISLMNRFIRACPYVAEIHMIIKWMSKPTMVSLTDYFMIYDMKLQLEGIIINKKEEPKKNQSIFIIGGCCLFCAILILLGPLFFMVDGATITSANPPISASIEIGVASMDPIWKGYATITTITKEYLQQVVNSGQSDLQIFMLSDRNTISLLSFNLDDMGSRLLTNSEIDYLRSNNVISPYFKMDFYFSSPTTASFSKETTISNIFSSLTSSEKSDFYQTVIGAKMKGYSGIKLPLALIVPESDMPYYIDNVYVTTQYYSNTNRSIIPEINGGYDRIPFLRSGTEYRCILYSQPVDAGGIVGQVISKNGGIMGIYFMIIFTLGTVLRSNTLGGVDTLWINRMKNPNVLYNMIIAIEAYRTAGELEKEKDLTDKFLDLMKSQDQVVRLTND